MKCCDTKQKNSSVINETKPFETHMKTNFWAIKNYFVWIVGFHLKFFTKLL